MMFHENGEYGPLGSIDIDVEPKIIQPGVTLLGRVRYGAPAEPRLVRSIAVALISESREMVSGLFGEPQREVRHAFQIANAVVCAALPVPGGTSWTTDFTLVIPDTSAAPTLPGHLDHYVEARADIEGAPIVHRVRVRLTEKRA